MRLIGKWLHAGSWKTECCTTPRQASCKVGSSRPCCANIFLHHVLDEWFEREVQPRLKGRSFLIRFADDCAPRRREGGFMN